MHFIKYGLFGLWNKKEEKKTEKDVIIPKEERTDIVDKTNMVYLEDPELAAKVPLCSKQLPPSDFIGEEPDISDEEVKANLSSKSKTP